MQSATNRVKRRIESNLRTKGSTVTVFWDVTTGTEDPGTGALVGGTSSILSGTLKAFIYEVPARSVVREFVEIKVGDLIADTAPDGIIDIAPGQILSGTNTLDALQEQNLRFGFQGRIYEQKDVGGRLAAIWDCVASDVPLHRTLLLRLS